MFLRGGGNVTGIASHAGSPDDHEGERAFALESLIPAGQTIATTVVGDGFQSSVWRIKTLTVELEPNVAPEISVVEGSETGITRISTVYWNNSKHNFVLKNGRLHVWADGGYESVFDSRDFIFDGGESGVLDFWTSTGVAGDLTILIETVEGFVLFESPRGRQIVRQFVRNLPDSPDQIGLLKTGTEAAVVALKDVLSASVGDDSSRWYENDLRTLSETEEEILEATVVQYPNPTSDTLYLRYPSASNVDYGLFDRNGRFLGTYSKTGKEHRFDVSGLSKGMYFLKATSDGVTYDYYRFLVN